MNNGPLHGLVAEFEEAPQVVAAARQAHALGYRAMDAYTPFAVEGLAEALQAETKRVALVTLICALTGSITGYGMQYYSAVMDYPLNVGGRPLHSWPMFVPITFELTVLFGAIGGVLGMLIMNGLPHPHHPIFDTPFFEQRCASRFYLCLEATDPLFEEEKTRTQLLAMQPAQVWEVPAS
ncbi:MAG: quinol:cytochrome c oxidoreductase rane protein [Verrucomicrobiaceae bacterium]|nr:quinol:cytochrome c oxidoreductase rane protein [Verrucomicrobiaceae bacterium]